MVRSFPLTALACVIAICGASCSAERPPADAAYEDAADPAPVPAATAAPAPPAPPPSATAATAVEAPPPLGFSCDGGARVDIGPLAASVQFGDGRRVELARDPDNAFHFRSGALEFRMRGTSGELVRDEGGRTPCTAG